MALHKVYQVPNYYVLSSAKSTYLSHGPFVTNTQQVQLDAHCAAMQRLHFLISVGDNSVQGF